MNINSSPTHTYSPQNHNNAYLQPKHLARSLPGAARWLCLVLSLFAFFNSAKASLKGCRVPSEYPTIAAALENCPYDTIILEPRTFSEATGEKFPIRVRKPVTIMGMPRAHIQGDGKHTVLLIETGGVTLKFLDITDGMGSEGINKMDGGGICIFVGPDETRPVTISDCEITANSCPTDETYDGCGGGIYCGGTYCTCFKIQISNCNVHHNIVRGQGGGIFCALLSNVDVNDNTLIHENIADDHGGGVFVDVFASLRMADTKIERNESPGDDDMLYWGGKGGGLACESFGIFTATDCNFAQNTAKYFGGAVFTRGGLFAGEDVCGGAQRFPYLARTTVTKNYAGFSGGGVFVGGVGILTFLSTTLYHNDAGFDGGAVFVDGGPASWGEIYFADCNLCEVHLADCTDGNDCVMQFPDCNDCNDCKLEGNECGGHGGAVYLASYAQGRFRSTRFLGNSSLKNAGALFLEKEADSELTNCLITYNNSARGYAGGIYMEPNSTVDVNHCSIVGNFAPRKRSAFYFEDINSIVNITNSILFRNAGGSLDANDANVTITGSLSEDGPDPNNGVICCNPQYVGWGPLNHVYVDASATCPGIGTFGSPYCDLQVALDAFDFHLSPNSPCVGTADDGGNMGADTGVGGLAGNIIAPLHLAEGNYDIRGRNIIFTRGIYGDWPIKPDIINAVFGYVEDANVMDLAITGEEIFGGIVTRANVQFDNCHIHTNNANADGGGIYVADANCIITQSLVSDNTCSDNGAGLYASPDVNTIVTYSIITSNRSDDNGGGLYLDVNSLSLVKHSHLSSNTAGNGAGIYVSGLLHVTDSNLMENGAGVGGGIYVNTTADVNVTDSNFVSNWAGNTAGALMCYGQAQIDKSRFSQNRAGYGGAIAIRLTGKLFCRQSLFTNNTTGWNGGALYIEDTDPCFLKCEFQGNQARHGGAGVCYYSTANFEDCNFINNTSWPYDGGCFDLTATETRFHECDFTDSYARRHGGVARLRSSDASLFQNCDCNDSTARLYGGAFFIGNSAQPVFSDVNIVHSRAVLDNGGGIAIFDNAKPTFTHVTISDCNAMDGGGVYAKGNSKSTFHQCRFRKNQAHEITEPGDGGGAYFTENACASFSRCEFRENYARDDGGGIGVAERAKVDLRNTLFAANNATHGGGGAHFTYESDGVFTNCTIASNEASQSDGAGVYFDDESTLSMNSSIVWLNSPCGIRGDANNATVTYSCLQEAWYDTNNPDPNNIVADPLFADPCQHDYHIKSKVGRWEPNSQTWVKDDVHSPCIDTGDPNLDWTPEPHPHGKRINMGAYGGTPEASMSLSDVGNMTDLNGDNSIDFRDFALFAQQWLGTEPPFTQDFNRDNNVNNKDLKILLENWLMQFADLDPDGYVNLTDYAVFASRWLHHKCAPSGWCDGADLDKSGNVDIIDLAMFATRWLAGVTPPQVPPEAQNP